MDKFTEVLLEKFDKEKIKQKSKTSIRVNRLIDFLLFFLIIVADAILFSLVFFYVREIDFDIVNNIHRSFINYLPYFWIFLSLSLICASYLYFYYKFKGYRLNYIASLTIVIVITFVGGVGINFVKGFNDRADEVLSLNMPFYYNTILNDDIWDDCCDGAYCDHCLLGRLKAVAVDNNKNIISLVDDRDNAVFSVFYEGNIRDVYSCNFIINNRYKIIAKREESGLYKILEIRPWHSSECPKKR